MAKEVPALKWAEIVGRITLYEFSVSLCALGICYPMPPFNYEPLGTHIWIISTSCTSLLCT